VPDPTDDVRPFTVIAIDGPAGSGKSTVGRAVAEHLGLQYLDTGAMYRGVTFAALRLGIDPTDAEVVANLARNVELTVDEGVVTVDGVDATIEIRGPEVTRAVSVVAANPEVRNELVRRQRRWARERNGGVLEGRDIGTVVFPDAAVKVYLTASPEVRAERRSKEVHDLDYATVASDIARRDALDQGRATSPLTQAVDSVEVDTSHRSVDEIVELIVGQLGARPTSDEATSSEPATPAPDEPPGRPAGLPSAAELTRRADRNRHGHARAGTPGELRFYAAVRAVLLGFARVWLRVSAQGTQHVPAEGAFILSPVHRSNLDFLIVLVTTRRRLRFLAKDSLWKGVWGRIFTALGGIPVARGTADREALRTCIEVIEAGEPLVIFPEGTRQFGPEVQPLFDGPAFVQSRTGVPIIPVGIGGSEAAMPKGAKVIKPQKVRVVVGEPLRAGTESGSKARRAAVRARTAELHGVLQELFDEAQRQAGTPNRPTGAAR
jgi:cytidylate kinase